MLGKGRPLFILLVPIIHDQPKRANNDLRDRVYQLDTSKPLLINSGFDGLAETMKILMVAAMQIERKRYLHATT
jgi:hypothetical protein